MLPAARLALLLFCVLVPASAQAQRFRKPVACDNCINYWYYVDQDPSGGVRDWNCLTSTYDAHMGSDYSLRGGNASIEAGNDVVAMADGTVVSTQDGFYDRCTQCGGANCGLNFGNGFANQVIINHGSYRTIYGHMRMGSIRVQPGQTVTCGQVIGQIGSSGCSTGAHLHVEPRLISGGSSRPVDPYMGACSPTQTSLWVSQGAHRSMPGATCEGAGGTAGTGGMAGTNGASGTAGTNGASGTAGTNGASGTSGTAGMSGTGGRGGTAGTGGASGTSGSAGSGGTAGSAGTGPTGGSSGSAGSGAAGAGAIGGNAGGGGTSGSGGAGGAAGTSGALGGTASGGTGGNSGSAGASGASGRTSAVGGSPGLDTEASCTCHMVSSAAPASGALSWLGFVAVTLALRRRKKS